VPVTRLEDRQLLTIVEGIFVKVALATEVGTTLARGLPHRPAARFNRSGQDALYLSPDEQSARVAIAEYVRPNDPLRILASYEVERCTLFDLRHPDAACVYALARVPWRKALAEGVAPASWQAADYIRQCGHVGLIDPSRRREGLWHITLLRWNEAGAPGVRQIGEPVPITVEPEFR
jgi:RES domain-containing protein